MMRVLLVTSWDTRCGIAEYAKLLKESVEAADPEITVLPHAGWLDPTGVEDMLPVGHPNGFDLIHLNHHDALHSRWQATHVKTLTDNGIPVVVTYHDTRETLEQTPKLRELAAVASSTIVHEPVEGLNAIYWRQGIPAPAVAPLTYACYDQGNWRTDSNPPPGYGYEEYLDKQGYVRYMTPIWKAYPQQPVLGTFGFDFPWKNFLQLAEETAKAGWAYVCLAHNMSDERAEQLKALNPYSLIVREFLPTPTIVNYLAGCDVTAFMYECANTGTSGAIRTGLAARKPVLAFSHCRQFRDLLQIMPVPSRGWSLETGIGWVSDWGEFHTLLGAIPPLPHDPFTTRFAHQDSWRQRGKDHAQLYRMLAEGRKIDA